MRVPLLGRRGIAGVPPVEVDTSVLAPAASASGMFQRKQRTSGDLSPSGLNWSNLDTNLDLQVNAEAGDLVEVSCVGVWKNPAQEGYLDAVSLVSGSPVKNWSKDAAPVDGAAEGGVLAWWGVGGTFSGFGGSIAKAVAANEISDGVLTIRFRVYVNHASNTKGLFASSFFPLTVWARNLG